MKLLPSGIVVLCLLVAGCAAPQRTPEPDQPGEQTSKLVVWVPCMLSLPIQEIVRQYEQTRPDVKVTTRVEKPVGMLAALEDAHSEASVVVTMGEVEMAWLASKGIVDPGDVRSIALSTYEIAVVTPAERDPPIGSLVALAEPDAGRILIEDPSQSTLGNRAEAALEELGLWSAMGPKVVRPDPQSMILAVMLSGEAEAAVVYKDCLFSEDGSEEEPPETIAIAAVVTRDVYAPIVHQVAPVQTSSGMDLASDFVAFLTSPAGAELLQGSGLAPVAPEAR